jgi:hypothetical protein
MADGSAPETVPALPPAAVDPGPRLYGVFDVARPDRVAGWAIDRADARASVLIELLREGRPVATVRADRHRPDLVKGGVGGGDYGFSIPLDPPLEPGFEFTLTAFARAADGTRIALRRGTKNRAGLEPRVVERIFEAVTAERVDAPLGPEVERLTTLIERIETLQHRLEAALSKAPETPPSGRDLRGILYATLAIALGALGTGLYSLFG